MAIIRLTKEFDFEMAHALWNYQGACKNIHGHSYKLLVTVKGESIDNEKSNKFGMLIDFKDLKKIINENIIYRFDHALALYKNEPTGFIENSNSMFGKIEMLDYQPTCENLVAHFALLLKDKLPDNVKLFSLKLHETGSSYCEWYKSDN